MSAERMNPLDVWFLHVEDDVDHLHIGSVGIFEGPPPDYGQVLDLFERKLQLVPRYRQRVQRVPLELGRPVWVDDPHFSLTYHVRHTALPRPGNRAQLDALVGRLMSQPLDQRRPLWEMWVVEGLAEERWALVSKIHHCIVDGVAGTDLVATVLDVAPDPVLPAWEPWSPQPAPRVGQLVRDALRDEVGDAGRLVRSALRRARSPVEQARGVARRGRGLVELARLARTTPRSSLNGPIGPDRRWTSVHVRRDDVDRVRAAFGGTLNDVVLAAITRGFRDLLRERGELPGRHEVRTLVPVSLREEDQHGLLDNRVAALFAGLPVDVADPVDRLAAVRARMERLKSSGEDAATAALVAATAWVPPLVVRFGMGAVTRVVRRTGQRTVNTVTTNVPGPPIPLYVLGRRMLEAHPFVPIAEGVRVGIAILTYDGGVTFGLTGDQDTTRDLHVLGDGIVDGVHELVQAAAHRPARPAASAPA